MKSPSTHIVYRRRFVGLLLADAVMLPMAWALAMGLTGLLDRADGLSWWPLHSRSGQIYSLMAVLMLLTLLAGGHYQRRTAFWEEVRQVWRLLAVVSVGGFALNFFAQVSFTRTVTVLAWMSAACLMPLGRLMVREWLIGRGHWRHRAMLVGEPDRLEATAYSLQRERHVGLQVVQMLPILHGHGEHRSGADPVTVQEVEDAARALDCHVIAIVLEERLRPQTAALIRRLHAQEFEVLVVQDLEGLPVQGMQMQTFMSNDLLVMRLQPKLLAPVPRLLKRGLDLMLAGLALLLLSPLMAWVAWRIWREDGGPVLYVHERVGRHGRLFRFFKFRSMVRDADHRLAAWAATDHTLYQAYVNNHFKLPDDPRVLHIGRLIRRASLDELPQLWNVLRGDMSMVGPRPLLARELSDYPEEALDLYREVRPGITGLWQVSGRSQTSFAQRANLDSWYVRNWSLWIDWVVLMKTVRVVLSARGAA